LIAGEDISMPILKRPFVSSFDFALPRQLRLYGSSPLK
jgi:hypothetical protein